MEAIFIAGIFPALTLRAVSIMDNVNAMAPYPNSSMFCISVLKSSELMYSGSP